jgi:hypothetical protein
LLLIACIFLQAEPGLSLAQEHALQCCWHHVALLASFGFGLCSHLQLELCFYIAYVIHTAAGSAEIMASSWPGSDSWFEISEDL